LPMLFYAIAFGGIALLSRQSASEFDAIADLRLSDPDSATRALERYVAKNPRHDLAWTILGHAYLDVDETEKAATAYERALAINPRRAEALTGMGLVRRREGRYDESLAFYEKAVAANPEYAQAHSSIAADALRRGDDAKALSYARSAFALDSTDAVIAANLALAYHYNGILPMRDSMTNVAERLGYQNMDALSQIYSGERTVRDP
jgi:tetratricopeptide (TPR) repeat protein